MSPEKQQDNTPPRSGESVQDTIKSFESILEMFPEDVSALESLVVAYQEAGDLDNANAKALTLADLMAQQRNWRRVQQLTAQVLEYDPRNARAQVLHENAENVLSRNAEAGAADASPAPAGTVAPSELVFDINGELDLAWFLLEHEAITQEQYDAAIAGLSNDSSDKQKGVSVSLLQELASMERVRIDKIVGALSSACSIPYVDVTKFEISEDIARLIPLETARKVGVLPFAVFGNEVMVAVLNPVNKGLHKNVAAYLGRKIHTYLTSPEELQSAIDHLDGSRKNSAAES